MNGTKEIIGNNVRKYLEAKGVKHNWVIDRLGISKSAFYSFLKGEGNVDQYEQQILRLFRIKDPFYFHQNEIELPLNIKVINKEKNFMDNAALSFHGTDSEDFKAGMSAFREFVELIDVLKPLSSQPVMLEGEYLDK